MTPRSGRAGSVSRRRQLRRDVSAVGRRDARAVGGCGGRDTRAADRLMGRRVLKGTRSMIHEIERGERPQAMRVCGAGCTGATAPRWGPVSACRATNAAWHPHESRDVHRLSISRIRRATRAHPRVRASSARAPHGRSSPPRVNCSRSPRAAPDCVSAQSRSRPRPREWRGRLGCVRWRNSPHRARPQW